MAPSRLTVALAPFRPRTVIGLAAISELAWRPPHGTSCGKDWETPSFPLIPSRWRWATRHPGPPAPAVATSDGRGHREQGDGQVFNVLISSCLPPTVGPGAHLEAAPPRFDSWHVVDWRCRPSLHCSETHLTRGGLPLSSLESRSPSSSKALDPLWKPSPFPPSALWAAPLWLLAFWASEVVVLTPWGVSTLSPLPSLSRPAWAPSVAARLHQPWRQLTALADARLG